MLPVVDVDFFNGKNWLCWDVGPALFSKVTLFSLPEVFCGPQICQKNMDPASADSANVKFWLRACKQVTEFIRLNIEIEITPPQIVRLRSNTAMDRFSDVKRNWYGVVIKAANWRGSVGLKLQCIRNCHVF